MIVVISTCNRKPEYIHETIASLLLADRNIDKICLVVDGSAEYLKYYNNPLIVKYEQSETDKEFLKENNIPQIRGMYNYCRCLKLVSTIDSNFVILEDDVVTKTNWIEDFNLILNEIKDENPYLLSLRKRKEYKYPVFKNISKNVNQIIQTPVEDKTYFFDGAQACYFSKNFPFEDLISFLLLEKDKNIPYDLQIARFLVINKLNAYHSVVGLFKHVGYKTMIGTSSLELH